MRRGLWLLTPLLLLALLYASLPLLAGHFATRWLEMRGFEQAELTLEYPGYRRLRISQLAFGQRRPGRHIELRGAVVEIGYDLHTLLFEHRLSWLRVPRIDLRITDDGSASDGAETVALAPLLPAAWLAMAPADQVQIGQMRLDYAAPSQPHRRLEGNIDLSGNHLSSRLLLFENDTLQAQADLQLQPDVFSLSLLQDNLPLLETTGHLRPEDDQLVVDLTQRLWLSRAQEWQHRWLPQANPLPNISGDLQARGRLRLPLEIDLGDDTQWWSALELEQTLTGDLVAEQPLPELERLRLALAADLQLQNGHVRLQVQPGRDTHLDQLALKPFAPADVRMRLLSPAMLTAELNDMPGSVQLSPLTLELATGPLQQPTGSLQLTPLRLQLERIDPARWLVSGNLEVERLDWQDNKRSFGVADLSGGFELRLDGGHLRLQLTEGSGARVVQLPLPPFDPLDAELRLSTALDFSAETGSGAPNPRLGPVNLVLSPAPLRYAAGELELSPLQLRLDHLDLQHRSFDARLSAERIHWQAPGQQAPVASLQSDLHLEGETLSGGFELRLDDPAVTLRGRTSSRLSPLSGDLYWQATPVPLQQAARLWNRYHPPAPPELGVSGGTLHLEGSVNWTGAGTALRFDQRIEQLAANWGATRIEGGQWRARTLVRRSGRIEQDGSLQLALLDIGFPIESIAGDYRYLQAPQQVPELHLSQLSAELLGGALAVDSVTINPLAPKLATKVTLQHLELARLLELQQQPGLSGEGRLSGILPLRFDDEGLRISAGQIGNETPGWLRYEPDDRVAALGRSNQGMAMALEALRNFHYDRLSVGLQYAPDGTAQMNTRLRGSNPDWNRGQAVDFTINIEQNLLKLLQTLQFTGQLTESIEKRYR
ncbi:MAG: YdbH domain-containing protein [Oceanospirillaceae bacterium]|nr:YdbH domain-containing protein [Oceanospirillaceae bacterium]